MKKFIIFLIILFAGGTINLYAKNDGEIKKSIVKIYSQCNEYNYGDPWQVPTQSSASGSGCIISGNRILTCAHVVENAVFIQVVFAGDTRKYEAEVEYSAVDCDLAVLKVKDKLFAGKTKALDIEGLPNVGNKIKVYGFPIGGNELSVTEGIVSRIENHDYTFSNQSLLACQIDAAVNDGNSGGPVIRNGKIVGVAFQSNEEGENMGYMVPSVIINHFIKDISDGKYDGFPELAIEFQNMENSTLRAKYGMSDEMTGILINVILYGSDLEGVLKIDDVLLELDGMPISNDGTIEFRKGEKTSANYIIQNKFIGDNLKCKILRDKKVINLAIKLNVPVGICDLVSLSPSEGPATYFIEGGLVFEPLTINYFKKFKKIENASTELVYYFMYGKKTKDRKEIILLNKVLIDEVNEGYDSYDNLVISTVNGRKISCMKDLIDEFKNNKSEYHTIITETDVKIVLDRKKVDERNAVILRKYNIMSDRSEDLKGI